jgi:hypothetical protein
MFDEDFLDVVASLKWAANSDLSPDQRASIREMCAELAGISEQTVPLKLLLVECERRRKAEQRVGQLEQALIRIRKPRPVCVGSDRGFCSFNERGDGNGETIPQRD